MGMGFDLNVVQNLSLTGLKSDPGCRTTRRVSSLEWFNSFCKTVTQPISIFCKVFLNGFTNYKPPVHLDNLFNANMNNLMAIDFANKEVTCTDGVLPRWS